MSTTTTEVASPVLTRAQRDQLAALAGQLRLETRHVYADLVQAVVDEWDRAAQLTVTVVVPGAA